MKAMHLEPTVRVFNDLVYIKDKLRQKEKGTLGQHSLCQSMQPEVRSVGSGQHSRTSKKYLKKLNSPAKMGQVWKGCSKKWQSKQFGVLYGQMMQVKEEYQRLKDSYEEMDNDKGKEEESHQARLEETCWEAGRWKKIAKELELELERIRKECIRVVETEQFKNKRLEEIIQERDLTIQNLKAQLQNKKKLESVWTTACHSSFSFDPQEQLNIVLDHQHHQPQQQLEHFSTKPSKDLDSSRQLHPHHPKKEWVVIEAPNSPLKPRSKSLTFKVRNECQPEVSTRKGEKNGEQVGGRSTRVKTVAGDRKAGSAGSSLRKQRNGQSWKKI